MSILDNPPAGLTVFILLFAVLLPFSGAGIHTQPDTYAFLGYARALLSGDLFHIFSPAGITFDQIHVAPLYPLVLLSASAFTSSIAAGVMVAHTLIGLFVLAFAILSLRRFMPVALIGSVVLLTQGAGAVFFHHALSEWLALNLLICGLIASLVVAETGSLLAALTVALIGSLLPLTRAALTLCAPVLLLELAFIMRGNLGAFLRVATVGFLPLAAYLAFNFARLGEIGVVSSAANRFGVAMSMYQAIPRTGDSSDFEQFLAAMNAAREECSGLHGSPPPGEACFDRNMERGWEYGRRLSINLVETEQMMRRYAARVVEEHRFLFLQYALTGFRPPFSLALFSLISLGCALRWAKKAAPDRAVVIGAFVLLAWLYLFTCSAFVTVIYRYAELSNLLTMHLCLLTAGWTCVEAWRKAAIQSEAESAGE